MVSTTQAAEGNSAVFLMDGSQVSRQMRWSEFGAFLDGYVGLSDLAETDVRAVLVNLNPDLTVTSLVFFRIWFDEEGRADSSWNVPIEALAEKGAKGPDLGGGAIRLVCRSLCPDPAYIEQLWDPDMTPGSNHFHTIRKAVEANTLHFRKVEPAEENIPVLTNSSSATTDERVDLERARLAQVLREQRLRIKTLQSVQRDALSDLQREHRLEMQALRSEMTGLEQKHERLRVSNEQLKQRLQERNEQYLALQEQLGDGTSTSAETESGKADAETVLLRDQLERKERELELREEKLIALERENHELKNRQVPEDSLLDQLRNQVVFLVAYHPGVGHITLPYDDIETYFSNPQAYAAEQCGMNEAAYREWMAHYENPVCTHADDSGTPCGEPVMRVTQPADFEAGKDDRCEQHKA